MKRLVLCFDGTWNTLADPEAVTNVVKVADLIALQDPKGVNQICYYNAGVGSGGPIDRITGGIFGAGLKNNVKRGLAFLTQNYDPGINGQGADEIYLFGFSRGAYTARAVAGVIGTVGIPWEIRNSEEHWEDYRKIAKLMSKQRGLRPGTPKYERLQAEINTIQNEEKKDEDKRKPQSHKPENIKIKCIAVFDTVGSYGVPAGLGLSGLPHLFTYWTRGFRSRRIGSKVDVALHAMAIDEMRRPFMPTFWVQQEGDKIGKGQIVEQMWFPGVHCNVGGGYPDKRISDMALAWMISRVKEHTHLEFNEKAIFQEIWPCAAGIAYRTSKRAWLAKSRVIMPIIEKVKESSAAAKRRRLRVNENVHWSVKERHDFEKAPVDGVGFQKYAPPNLKVENYSKPTELERALCSPNRDWHDAKCPLKAANQPCVCKMRQPRYFAGPPADQSAT